MFLEHEFFANEPDWSPAGKAEIKRRVVEARSGNSTTDLKLHADYKKFMREVPRNFCLPRKQLQAIEEVEELENEDDEAEVSYWNAELGHFALLPGTVFITDAEGLRQIRSHLPAKLRRLSNFAICARLSKLALKGILQELAPDQRANANEATQTGRRRKKWQRATVVQSFAKVVAAESDKDFKLKLQKIGVTMAAYLECYKNRRYDGVH